MQKKLRNNYKGFTLIELMVAISIFAIVSLLTMGGLSNVLSTQEHSEGSLQRLSRFQMVFTILERELQQFANRSVRDEYGAELPAISHETGEGNRGIEFTHQGRFTPGDQIRLQRVAYYLEDKQLIKKTWVVLDRVEDTEPLEQVLLKDIDELQFSFYNSTPSSTGLWQEDVVNTENVQVRAVKLAITTPDYKGVHRIFEVMP